MQKYNSIKTIIGLDHGYGNMKTAHRIFRTGMECFEEEPIVSTNYIKYKDKYYVIGENHLIYQGNKTDSQDFFIRFTGRVYIFVNGVFTVEYMKIKAFNLL